MGRDSALGSVLLKISHQHSREIKQAIRRFINGFPQSTAGHPNALSAVPSERKFNGRISMENIREMQKTGYLCA